MDTSVKNELSQSFKKFEKISDFFSELFKNAHTISKLAKFADLPIVKEGFDAAAESFEVVKFVLKFLANITRAKDVKTQAELFLTLVYEHATIEAFRTNPDIKIQIDDEAKTEIENILKKSKNITINLDTLDFNCLLSLDFIIQSDLMLADILKNSRVPICEIRKLTNSLHDNILRGVTELRRNNRVKENFRELFHHLDNRLKSLKAKSVLKEYANYNKWLFDECPLYREKNFALKDIYIEAKGYLNTDGRHDVLVKEPLVNKILSNIQDKKFKSLIAINGYAGVGKSSFTLRLCSKLIDEGFIPIAIPFKKIKFDPAKKHYTDAEIYEALQKAISLRDELRYGSFSPQIPNNLFCDGEIFNETTIVNGFPLSPYIVILDGWDELDSDMYASLKYFLKSLQGTFINNPNNLIRVIITGRPVPDIDSFLKSNKAVIFRIKQLNSKELEELLGKLNYFNPLGEKCVQKLIEKFESDSSEYDILKSPLIVFILHELLIESAQNVKIETLLSDKAYLYKKLADNTCANAGKRKSQEDSQIDSKLYGNKLREIIGKTAVIATIKGRELISCEDLKKILDENEFKITEDDISKILVSYYFKGGNNNAGCEFIHKSFREYFFAESLYSSLVALNENDFIHQITKYLFSTYFSDETELFLRDFINRTSAKELSALRRKLAKLWKRWLSQEPTEGNFSALLGLDDNFIKLANEGNSNTENFNSVLGYNILHLNILLNSVAFDKTGFDVKNLEITNQNGGELEECFTLFEDTISRKKIYLFEPFKQIKGIHPKITKILSELINNGQKWIHFEKCFFDGGLFAGQRPKINMSCCYLHKTAFKGVDLKGTIFEGCLIEECSFEYCDFYEAEFINSEFCDTKFNYTSLSCGTFEDCTASKITFEKVGFDDIDFFSNKLNFATFANVEFTDVGMGNCELDNSIFTNATFKEVSTKDCSFVSTKFKYCNFDNSSFNEQNSTGITIAKSDFIETLFNSGCYKNAKIKNCNIESLTFNSADLTNLAIEQSNIIRCTIPKKQIQKTKIAKDSYIRFTLT